VSDPDLPERRRLAEAIISASDSMPDPDKHLLWLLTRPVESLKQRLADLQGGGLPTSQRRGVPWLDRAVQKSVMI
jgi:hypothetical protein